MNRHRTFIAILLSIVFATTAFAQGAERPVTAEERRQVGEIVAHLFETIYVIPDTGVKVAEQLRANFASGKYDSSTTASKLAEAINGDLAAANDRHVNLRYTGKEASKPVLTIEAWKERRAGMQGA
ncbi:MAG TPA: hypothetical protein VFV49_14575, partial [Thermoanaerobaculia bacterium]|nr:hypothetical protein [Thermoanaerobaculia bacterium]